MDDKNQSRGNHSLTARYVCMCATHLKFIISSAGISYEVGKCFGASEILLRMMYENFRMRTHA